MKYLFLDDIRNPKDVAKYINPNLKSLYIDNIWDVVRNYNEFVKYIETNGVPDVISFDHDLADEHYRPSMYAEDKHYSNYYTDGTFKEKTGYDCAKWLLGYLYEKNLPTYRTIICHSMNPVGRENIENLFK